MFNSIVWATDGSQAADRALPVIEKLGAAPGVTLTVVHDDEQLVGRAAGHSALADEPELAAKIREQVAELQEKGLEVTFRVVRHAGGDPADAIAQAAREVGADVIVVGARGHGRLAGALLGSVTERLLHVGSCPVVAVPRSAQVESETKTAQLAVS